MKAFFALLLVVLLSSACLAAALPPAEVLLRIHKNRLDGKVYHIREVTLVREDVKFYFTEGTLALLEPLDLGDGRRPVLGALFVGEGEVLVIPPDSVEKRSLSRFADAPVLNEKFSSIFLRFTDDTAAQLLKAVRQTPAEPGVDDFIDQWTPVVQNLNLLYDQRVLADLLAVPPPGSPNRTLFAARLFGLRLGAIDISLDYQASEQVVVSQLNWREGKRYQDLWCSFPAASVRSAPSAWQDPMPIKSFRIDTTINAARQLDVTAEIELEARVSGDRVLFFELSRFLKVSAVELDGTALPFFPNETQDDTVIRRRSNDSLAVVLPEPAEKGRLYRLKVRYAGEVISDAGNGVFFVGARGIWYPNRGYHPASFELSFRYPKSLHLVATGDRVEEREEGETRVSRWKSAVPLRVAGFNIGDYLDSSAKAADGTVIEVYANRGLETALQAQRPATIVVNPQGPVGWPTTRRQQPPVVVQAPPPPSPAAVAQQMAKELAQVADFLTKTLGPLPFGHVAVSPIPGTFGQGWPGLVYLSTVSYLMPYDVMRHPTSESVDLFFRTILPVHELAHQWWGHVVRPASYREEWLIEGLSAYTALLWLEQESKSGPRHLRVMLEKDRKDLLQKTDDATAESVGPPVLGFRLASSKTPLGGDVVLYKKGTWILHMLRQLMRDPKTGSDAAFFKFLRAVREEFATRDMTTAGFRAVAEKFIYPELNAEKGNSLEWFFDQWVSGTGIPEISISVKADLPKAASAAARPVRGKITGSASLAAVDDSWILPVPIYAQTPRGEVLAGVVVAETGATGEQARFTLPLPPGTQKAVADPQQTLLAIFK